MKRGAIALALAWLYCASLAPAFAGAPNAARLGQWRSYFIAHPQAARDYVDAQPVTDGGHLVGYRIRPGKKPDLFQSLGLKSGDIVTQINGMAVSPRNQLLLIGSLSVASRVRLDLIRAGKPLHLTYPVQ